MSSVQDEVRRKYSFSVKTAAGEETLFLAQLERSNQRVYVSMNKKDVTKNKLGSVYSVYVFSHQFS